MTIVFTDMVGSTEISTRLTPAEADQLRQTHFSLLRGAVEAYGGTEVKNLGDGLMLAFPLTSSALNAAEAMQQAIFSHNHVASVPLSVRIGIATGEVTEENGDYFGDAVVEAARLCARADGGQILATQLIQRTAGRRATQEFTSVGALDLKGLLEPVPTVEVVWRFPEPDRHSAELERTPPLVRILGEVSIGSAPTSTPLRAQVRLLIAYLVMNRQRPVTRDELADLLWGESPPNQWQSALRGLLTKVRGAFTDAEIGDDSLLEHAAGSYRLTLPQGVTVDIDEAERHLSAAEQPDVAEPQRAVAEARRAASILGQPLLYGIEGVAWVEEQQRRLVGLRIRSLRALSTALSRHGQHDEAVEAAEESIKCDPWSEAGYRLLMAAHEAAGNRLLAIAAYERCRNLLRDEFGIRPSGETEAAYLDLLGEAPDAVEEIRPDTPAHPPPTVSLSALPRFEGVPLVGRQAHMERLATLWAESLRVARKIVFVSGEAGMGKTRLAVEAAESLGGDSTIRLYGRCREGLGAPFEPLVETLRAFVEVAPAGNLRGLLGAAPADLQALLPVLGELLDLSPQPDTDPLSARLRIFQAVDSWLETAGGASPMLLILDDLHWADSSTTALLSYLVSKPGKAGSMLICPYRADEVGADHALKPVLLASEQASDSAHLSLEGLDTESLDDLISTAWPDRPDRFRAAGAALRARTGGNPFFAIEVLRDSAVAADSAAPIRPATLLETPQAPRTVTALVEDRLRRLPTATVQSLQIASIIGREFEFSTLASLTALEEDQLLEALEAATAARLLVETAPEQWRFVHDLVREALYHSLSATRRSRLHLAVAQDLESRRPDDVQALAHHYSEMPSARAVAIRYLRASAAKACDAHAYDHAAAYLERAVELARQDSDFDIDAFCALEIDLGRAQRDAAYPVYRATLLDAAGLARQIGAAELIAEAAIANNRGVGGNVGTLDKERLDVLEAALEMYDPGDSPTRARLLAAAALEITWTDSEGRRIPLAEEALAMARRVNDEDCLLEVWTASLFSLRSPERAPQIAAELPGLVALADRASDEAQSVLAFMVGSVLLLELGDVEGCDELVARLDAIFERHDRPRVRWLSEVTKIACRMHRLPGDEIERLATASAELGFLAGEPEAAMFTAILMLAARIAQGRLTEIVDAVRSFAAEYTDFPIWRAGLAFVLAQIGEIAEASEVIEGLLASGDPFSKDYMWLLGHWYLGSALSIAGARDAAEQAYRELLPFSSRLAANNTITLGTISSLLGSLAVRLGRGEDAHRHFEDALEIENRIGAVMWRPRTQLAWGELLAAEGSAPRAAELLRSAQTEAAELGIADVERRAAAGLAELAKMA